MKIATPTVAALIVSLLPCAALAARPDSGPTPAALANGSAAASAACPALDGSDKVLAAGKRFVILGETHGTNEGPALFGDLICNVAAKKPVAVALELSARSTPALQAYVNSAGTPADRAKLLSDAMWKPELADGRASVAMLALLERLRVLNKSGSKITVYGAQPIVAGHLPQYYFELAMAREWSRIADENPDAMVLALAGKVHAAKEKRDQSSINPAASFLQPEDVVSLAPETEGGQAWNCQQDGCSEHDLPDGRKSPRFVNVMASSFDGYDGSYAVGSPYSAAPPPSK